MDYWLKASLTGDLNRRRQASGSRSGWVPFDLFGFFSLMIVAIAERIKIV